MFLSELLVSFMAQEVLDGLSSEVQVCSSVKTDYNPRLFYSEPVPDIYQFLEERVSFELTAADIEVHI